MAGALLVAGLDVDDVRVVQRVVGGQVGAAGDAEDVLDPLGLQRLAESIGRPHGREIVGSGASHPGPLRFVSHSELNSNDGGWVSVRR